MLPHWLEIPLNRVDSDQESEELLFTVDPLLATDVERNMRVQLRALRSHQEWEAIRAF